MESKGLALIVVHGVADQKPGDTARSLVELMVAGHAADAAEYEAVARTDFVVAVAPLQPVGSHADAAPRADATPRPKDRPLRKAWRQSKCSDLRVPDLIAQTPAAPAPEGARAGDVHPDRGIALTDYLLRKHVENGAGLESYESSCIGLERKAGGAKTPVTVYEMYWADLSRLSGALPRIATELFTMVFRLAKLGRDTLDEACAWRRPPKQGAAQQPAWNATMRMQTALDWLFANVLAPLFAQLVMLMLVFVVLGVAAMVPPEHRVWLHVPLLGGAALLSALVCAYHWRGSPPRRDVAIAALLVAVACLGAAAVPVLRPWAVGLLLVGAVTLIYDAGLRIGDARFPFLRRAGWVLWIALLAVVLASAALQVAARGADLDWRSFDVGWHATLFGVEVVLLAIKWWWIGAGFLLVAWFVAGFLAGRERSFESRASLATGRLGLAVSLASFLTLTMALWALLTTLIDVSARNVAYTPCIFAFDEAAAIEREGKRKKEKGEKAAEIVPEKERRKAHAADPHRPPAFAHCLWTTADARKADAAAGAKRAAAAAAPASAPAPASAAVPARAAAPASAPESSARLYLNDRYEQSTAVFSFLVAALLALFAYAAAMFTPSVLAEMKLLAFRTRDKAAGAVARATKRSQSAADQSAADDADRARVHRLGRWLTGGFVGLDGVVYVIVGFGALAGVGVTLAFLGLDSALLRAAEQCLSWLSRMLLEPLVLTAAGIVTMLSVLGGLLSRYLPPLRAPLDIALDVDNHFREFPRAAIPRARIFSRYAALLRHVVAQGHDRIVIVAHSQGTVISAELLRYLVSQGPGPAEQAAKAGSEGAAETRPGPWLDGRQLPKISLLTLGCPLRQLYAARFPTLYRWVLARDGTRTGPRAGDIGVTRWFNAFCSGDYVGRWLWSDSADDDDWLGHPTVDVVHPAMFGRRLAYDAFSPAMPPTVEPFQTRTELEVCLGFGAHTHYFETDMETVAWLVDELVAPAPWPQPPDRNIETP